MSPKKTSSKEVRAQKAAKKAPPGSDRPADLIGKIDETNPSEPVFGGTTVKVWDVWAFMGDPPWPLKKLADEFKIDPKDVLACATYAEAHPKPEIQEVLSERQAKALAKRVNGLTAIGQEFFWKEFVLPSKNCADLLVSRLDAANAWIDARLLAKEPPNPDENAKPEKPTPVAARKLVLSEVVPGKPVVIETVWRTLAVPLTEAEIAEKQKEVFTADDSIDQAQNQLDVLKERIKSITKHKAAIHATIRAGVQEKSVKCERVLEGNMMRLYRLDRVEPVESRPATPDERQLTLGVD